MNKGPRRVSLSKVLFYRVVQLLSNYIAVCIFDFRAFNRHLTHIRGPALILSTHQSHIDPVLVGITFGERLNYVARRTLFDNKFFGFVIRMLDAIELDRDRSGLAGLKETMKRLKQGNKVLVFPEGTRSTDGCIGKLKPGFLAVARRNKVPLIPMAIVGAYEALPRGQRIPRRFPLRVAVGKVITYEEFADLGDQEFLELVSDRLHACFDQAATTLEAGFQRQLAGHARYRAARQVM